MMTALTTMARLPPMPVGGVAVDDRDGDREEPDCCRCGDRSLDLELAAAQRHDRGRRRRSGTVPSPQSIVAV